MKGRRVIEERARRELIGRALRAGSLHTTGAGDTHDAAMSQGSGSLSPRACAPPLGAGSACARLVCACCCRLRPALGGAALRCGVGRDVPVLPRVSFCAPQLPAVVCVSVSVVVAATSCRGVRACVRAAREERAAGQGPQPVRVKTRAHEKFWGRRGSQRQAPLALGNTLEPEKQRPKHVQQTNHGHQ